jgi:hypothetical protein
MPQISRRPALILLAKSAKGHTETILRTHGLTRQVIDGLIRDGLATASTVRVGRGRQSEVIRINITEVGRRSRVRPS